jgi:hypothetical protein
MKITNSISTEHPVPPDKFAGRIHQIGEYDRFLVDTVEGNSKNCAVLGCLGRENLAFKDLLVYGGKCRMHRHVFNVERALSLYNSTHKTVFSHTSILKS